MSTMDPKPAMNPNQDVLESLDSLSQALQNAITLGVITAGSDLENHPEHILENAWNLMLAFLQQLETALDEVRHALGARDNF